MSVVNYNNIKIFIIESIIPNFIINREYDITIKQKLGSGSYGVVFDIENNLVIKIFFNSLLGKTCFEEKDCIIPYKNENRELSLYFKLIKENPLNHFNENIISPLVIGYLKSDFKYSNKEKDNLKNNSYFVIMPLCIPFNKLFKIKNNPLIDVEDAIPFVYEFSKKVIKASLYMEKKYNIINLDIKLNNIMYLVDNSIYELFENNKSENNKSENNKSENNKKKYHKNLMVLDFSLIKKNNTNRLFKIDDFDRKSSDIKYYLWPKEEDDFYLSQIPSYSISINILELFFGKDKVTKLPNNILIKDYIKKISKKYKNTSDFLHKCLIDKSTTENSYKLIDNLLLDNNEDDYDE